MGFDKKPPEGRQELYRKIQNLEWSLAQKKRENKELQAEVDEYHTENANLIAENEQLKGNRSSDNSDSGSTG